MKTVLRFIFKNLLILKKRFLLFEVEQENIFLRIYFKDELNTDQDDLVSQYQELLKDPIKAALPQTKKLQALIVEVGNAKARLNQQEATKKQLLTLIEVIKQA